ncbi:cryptococcal mannosyltransferase 1-domain-containing protein [Chiua virens]|nr:cryptococcal mannosyltransferase 1-domain-containing protein [Chiua virens]
MVGLPIFAAQRRLLAAAYHKTLLPLFRHLLKLVRHPGVTSAVLFVVLYSVAEYEFTNLYFALGFIWKPAFPLSWRLLLLSLFVLPVLAFVQLACLCCYHAAVARYWWRHRKSSSFSTLSQGYTMLPRSESNSLEERGGTLARDDEQHVDLDELEEDEGSPRPSRHQTPRLWLLRAFFWFGLLCVSLWVGLHYQHPGDLRCRPMIERATAHPRRAGYGNQEKIFIAAMFYNNERVIPYWSDSVIKAIHYLGEDNVFVSILESESGDRSAELLEQFDDKLAAMDVSRRILTHDTTIEKPEGDLSGNERIKFLSSLRNRVLEPLVETGGYDKVLFSNDVYVEPETIVELVNTADGEYDMACGMDFGHFGAYDMWVLRDKRGRLTSGIWPYFFDDEDYEAMKTESPAPVFTCWNGIVIFNADPLLPVHLRSNRTLSREPLTYELPATHPAYSDPAMRGPSPALTPPIGFRASAPDECYSSESFLLPYDFRRLFNLQRILVNPRVIVGYDIRFYVYFKWFMRHPVLKWWIEKVYNGAWMQNAVMVVGDSKGVWEWDGGDCHPWW